MYLDATRSDSGNNTVPVTRETATILATSPNGVDRALWLYELCRFLVQKTNLLIVGFFSDNPACSATNCPEMRASEWQYLCAVHDPPKSCCAIDYCCHTLDWAANALTSQKNFPSRLTLGGDAPGSGREGVKTLTNIFRRVYRMFAHAWFQHRDVFWTIENTEGLYVFYKTVCDIYQLIPEENYTVPPEAEGLTEDVTQAQGNGGGATRDLYSAGQGQKRSNTTERVPLMAGPNGETIATTTLSTGATTRRHKTTPSTGSFVTSIAEADEGEEPEERRSPVPEPPLDVAQMLKNVSISDADSEATASLKDGITAEPLGEAPATTQANRPPEISVADADSDNKEEVVEQKADKMPVADQLHNGAADATANGNSAAEIGEAEKAKQEAST